MVTRSELFEERLKNFALNCAKLVKDLPRTTQNLVYGRQLIKSSSSPGANYAEAVCALTRRDFTYDINKCRKETKESYYWLDLIFRTNPLLATKIKPLLTEAHELIKIFQKTAITLRNKNRI